MKETTKVEYYDTSYQLNFTVRLELNLKAKQLANNNRVLNIKLIELTKY